MSLPYVKISFANGAIGGSAAMDDGCTGLICTAVAVPSTFALNTNYLITSLKELEALGITASSTGAIWYGGLHINDPYLTRGYYQNGTSLPNSANVKNCTGNYVGELSMSQRLWFADAVNYKGAQMSRVIGWWNTDATSKKVNHAWSVPIHSGRHTIATFGGDVRAVTTEELNQYYSPLHIGSGVHCSMRVNIYAMEFGADDAAYQGQQITAN